MGVSFFGEALFIEVNACVTTIYFSLKVLEKADEALTSV